MGINLLYEFGCHKADRSCLNILMAVIQASLARYGMVVVGSAIEEKLVRTVLASFPKKVPLSVIDSALERIANGNTAGIKDGSWEAHLRDLFWHSSILTLVLEMLSDGFGEDGQGINTKLVNLAGVTAYADAAFKAKLGLEDVCREVSMASDIACSRYLMDVSKSHRVSHLVQAVAPAIV